MARTTINTQVIPDGTIVSADLSYPLTDFSSTGIDDNASSTSLTIDSSGNITVTGTVDGRDLATDGTKLDGIEASADVTDTANVTAAGALMDSEVTNLAQVKAFSSSDYATAAQGATADSALQNIVEDITPQLGGDLASNGSDILFADSDKAIFGAGSDLQIYHDGSNSIVQEVGTGDLRLAGNVVRVRNSADTENMISAVQDGPVTLCFDGNGKLATTSTGIDVTGTVTSDGLTLANATYISQSDSASVQPRVFGLNPSNNMYIGPIDSYAGGSIFYGVSSGVSSQVLYTGGTERMRIDSSGNVGIGTSSPSQEFHLRQTSGDCNLLIDSANGASQIFFGDDESVNIGAIRYDHASNYMRFSTNSAERMRIDSSGRFLINKVSTTGALQLEVLAPTGFSVVSGFYSPSTQSTIDFKDANTTANYKVRIGSETDDLLLFAGGSERMRIDSSGNVGIGTSSPDGTLHVKDAIAQVYIQSNDGQPAQIVFGDASDASRGRINYDSSDNIIFENSNLAERMRIDSSGSILYYTGGGKGYTFGASGSSADVANMFCPAGYTLAFGTNNAERMRISSTGGVGIGTTSPSKKLHVSASGSAAQILLESTSTDNGQMIFKNATATTGFYVGLLGDTSGNALLYHGDQKSIQFWTNSTERMVLDSSGNLILKPGRRLYLESSSGFSPNFLEASNGLTINTNNTERMRIDSSGKVGIGTSNPDGRLHITGGAYVNNTVGPNDLIIQSSDVTGGGIRLINHNNNHWFMYNGGTGSWVGDGSLGFVYTDGTNNATGPKVTFKSSGNVGIGTTSPASELHINSTGETVVTIDSGGTAFASVVSFVADSERAKIKGSYASGGGGQLAFHTDTAGGSDLERMRIDSSGNVGIGTTAPAQLLDVNGTAVFGGATTRLTTYSDSTYSGIFNGSSLTSDEAVYMGGDSIFFYGGGTERMRIDSSGNVGIGTTSTTFRFNVSSASSTTTNLQSTSSTSNLRLTNSGGLATIGSTSNVLHFTTSTTERMRIDGSGHVLVGTTSTVTTGSEGIELRGDFGYLKTARNNTGSTGHWLLFNPNGNVGSVTTSGSATQYNTSSDQRLKENIVDAPAGNIDAIRVRSFDWKADGSHQTYGMVAQELVDVAPEAVSQGATEDDMWGVDYSKLVPMMIKEIQDLKAEVAALRGV